MNGSSSVDALQCSPDPSDSRCRGRLGFASEVTFNLALFILGIAIIAGSVQLGFGDLSRPGAGLFPFFAGLAICAGEMFIILPRFSRRSEQGEFVLDRYALRKLGALIFVLAAWILAMPVLGYIVVTFAAVLTLAKLLDLQGWRIPLLLSAGTSLLVYVMFDRLLYLDLPRGVLW